MKPALVPAMRDTVRLAVAASRLPSDIRLFILGHLALVAVAVLGSL
jgi:hypothetical protein